jgi:hypothetical protein
MITTALDHLLAVRLLLKFGIITQEAYDQEFQKLADSISESDWATIELARLVRKK